MSLNVSFFFLNVLLEMASNSMDDEELNQNDLLLESAINKLTISETNKNKNINEYDSTWLKGTAAESELAIQSQQVKTVDFSHPIYKTISKLNGKINSMSYLELSKCLKDLKLDPR